nr:MAG TPA: hypothetical protein [Caudoviricetes sp.]
MKIDSELRPCLVDGKKAVFHCWEQCAKVLEPSLIKGGHNGGQLMWTQAVCEDENGKIFKVFPLNRLVFCDNKFKKYFKED